MLNRNELTRLHKSGISMAELGRKFGVTRQRIHQIIFNYKNHGRKNRPEFYENFDLCLKCFKRKAEHLHHVDFNNLNDQINNLLPVCGECHRRIHILKRASDHIKFMKEFNKKYL